MQNQQEKDEILKIIATFPDGASLKEIRTSLNLPLDHVRTMQRQVASLIKENRLVVKGMSHTRRYQLPNESTTSS